MRINLFNIFLDSHPSIYLTLIFFLFKIAERICPIMHTNFGEMWEARADLQHQDSAYTNEKVPPHNDNTYWREPAG